MSFTSHMSGLYSHLENRVFSNYWHPRAPHIVAGLALKPSDHVLEIGCGSGKWAATFSRQVALYAAFDLYLKSVQNARLWKGYDSDVPPTANVKFSVMSATEIGFSRGTFDKVFAVDVIEHIPNEAGALREMHRVLKPGGRLVLSTLLEDRPAYIKRTVFADHVREYTTEHFQKLFTDNGFKIEHTFYFYYALSTIARELETVAHKALKSPALAIVRLGASAVIRPLNDLERLTKIGQPGGIGIVATALDSLQE